MTNAKVTFARAVTPRQRMERRAQLIRGGLDAEHGEAFSVNAAARTAGVSKGTIYLHFDSGEDFYLSVLETAAAEVMQAEGDLGQLLLASPVPRLLTYATSIASEEGRARLGVVLNGLEAWLTPAQCVATPYPQVSHVVGAYLTSLSGGAA